MPECIGSGKKGGNGKGKKPAHDGDRCHPKRMQKREATEALWVASLASSWHVVLRCYSVAGGIFWFIRKRFVGS